MINWIYFDALILNRDSAIKLLLNLDFLFGLANGDGDGDDDTVVDCEGDECGDDLANGDDDGEEYEDELGDGGGDDFRILMGAT